MAKYSERNASENISSFLTLRTSPEAEYKLRQKLAERILSDSSLSAGHPNEAEADLHEITKRKQPVSSKKWTLKSVVAVRRMESVDSSHDSFSRGNSNHFEHDNLPSSSGSGMSSVVSIPRRSDPDGLVHQQAKSYSSYKRSSYDGYVHQTDASRIYRIDNKNSSAEVRRVGKSRDRSRSKSPTSDNRQHSKRRRSPSTASETPPAAPQRKEIPEHIKWLHDRWSKYDQAGFFSKSSVLKPADLSSKEQDDHFQKELKDYKAWRENKNSSATTQKVPNNERQQNRRFRNACPGNSDDRPGFWNKKVLEQKSAYMNWRYGGLSRDQLPHLMSFKEFLLSLPDDIGDDEQEQLKAINLYTEYKLNFKRRTFREFFDQHKDEEWFLQKYHPAYKIRHEARRKEVVRKRLDAFMFLLVRGWIETHVEYTDSRKIRKLLDAACVLLQDGKEQDIMLLSDFDYMLEEKRELSYDLMCEEREKGIERPDQSSDRNKTFDDEGDVNAILENERIEEEEKRKSATELEIAQHARDYSRYVKAHTQDVTGASSDSLTLPPNVSTTETEARYIGEGVFVERPKLMLDHRKPLSETSLHQYVALCIKDLSPKIFRQELESVCSECHGGFYRLYLSEPDPLRNYCRQALVSFRHDANLMRLCWNLRAHRLSDGSTLNVVEHRDFSKRVELIDGLASDKSIVLRDIQLCKSLIEFLDQRHLLWASQAQNPAAPKANPLLMNLDECLTYHLRLLIESGHVKDLSDIDATVSDGAENRDSVKHVDRDENLIKILDRLILYLRIVHSIDYYGCTFNEDEDDQPRRIGAIHLRGPCYKQATPKQLAEHIQAFEENLQRLLPNESRLADEHVELLGKKDLEVESENFVKENILSVQDGLSKCCACYKRFTSLEFALEHFKQKHVDRIEQHKLEVVAFNNYLYDPTRMCHVQFGA